MSYHQYRSPFGDTTFTKVFVGGLAWETPTDIMRRYFEQFGEILEAVIINDKNTGNSKGYGFVTFRDPESAKRACDEPNPIIDGRKANCNIASLGRSRPRVTEQEINSSAYGGGIMEATTPAQPVFYPSYGYGAYPAEYGYHQNQSLYNTQQQFYGTGMGMGPTYYYGYSSLQQPSAPARGNSFAAATHQAQRIPAPSYLYYPTQMDSSFTPYNLIPRSSPSSAAATTTAHQTYPPKITSRHQFASPADLQSHSAQQSSNTSETEIESGGNCITSENPRT